jgi:hypothetical protein
METPPRCIHHGMDEPGLRVLMARNADELAAIANGAWLNKIL